MSNIKPSNGTLANLRAPIAGTDKKGGNFKAALVQGMRNKTSGFPFFSKSPVQKRGDAPVGYKRVGIVTVGRQQDMFSGSSKLIKTYVPPAKDHYGNSDNNAETSKARFLANKIVNLVNNANYTKDGRTSDPHTQSKLRENLSRLSAALHDIDVLEELKTMPARDVAMIRGLFALNAVQ